VLCVVCAGFVDVGVSAGRPPSIRLRLVSFGMLLALHVSRAPTSFVCALRVANTEVMRAHGSVQFAGQLNTEHHERRHRTCFVTHLPCCVVQDEHGYGPRR
jgi:hypothetical protein